MMPPLAELQNVSRTFDNRRIVGLDRVSLTLERHETVALVGPSGSGKSTLVNLLCGLDRPCDGRILFNGERIEGMTAWARLRAREIGIVFQQFCLLPTLTARENIEIAMSGGVAARRLRSVELLRRVGLEQRAEQLPVQLSGGERQRVAIARALAARPKLIVADEPTGSLDRVAGRNVIDLLMSLQQSDGIAILLVTHDLDIAARCHRQIELVDGRIVHDARRANGARDAIVAPDGAPS